MTVDYNDAMQILEDPKAAAWELRDLAKSLLEDLQAARTEELERCALAMENQHTWITNVAAANIIRALGDKP